MLPNFLIIGAMKSGTTTLWKLLNDHPDIFLSPVKEPMFFNNDAAWDRGLEWYESLFEAHEDQAAVGEGSTGYSKFPHVERSAERIHRTLSDVRLIYVVRNPIDRMYSHYVHNVCEGRITKNFETVVSRLGPHVRNGLYAAVIDIYERHFDRDRLHVVVHDDLASDLPGIVRGVQAFLGVGTEFISRRLEQREADDRGTRFNSSRERLKRARSDGLEHVEDLLQEPPVLSPATRSAVIDLLAPDIGRLGRRLDRDLAAWDPAAALDRLADRGATLMTGGGC